MDNISYLCVNKIKLKIMEKLATEQIITALENIVDICNATITSLEDKKQHEHGEFPEPDYHFFSEEIQSK